MDPILPDNIVPGGFEINRPLQNTEHLTVYIVVIPRKVLPEAFLLAFIQQVVFLVVCGLGVVIVDVCFDLIPISHIFSEKQKSMTYEIEEPGTAEDLVIEFG